MKTKVYYITDLDDFILVRRYADGFNYIADKTTWGRPELTTGEKYDKDLDLSFCFTWLPMAYYKNLKFIGYL